MESEITKLTEAPPLAPAEYSPHPLNPLLEAPPVFHLGLYFPRGLFPFRFAYKHFT
jgi:hypothetical protein